MVKKKEYIPMKRDIVFVDLNPIKGHEQKGFRAAVIISNNPFNQLRKWLLFVQLHQILRNFLLIIV